MRHLSKPIKIAIVVIILILLPLMMFRITF